MINLKKIVVELSVIVVLISNSSSLNAALFPDISLPDEELLEILETGPDWLPKPYKIPIDQGVLLETENLNKVIPGLSKDCLLYTSPSPRA